MVEKCASDQDDDDDEDRITHPELVKLFEDAVMAEIDAKATEEHRQKMQAVLDKEPKFVKGKFRVTCSKHACVWVMDASELKYEAADAFTGFCEQFEQGHAMMTSRGGPSRLGLCMYGRSRTAKLPLPEFSSPNSSRLLPDDAGYAVSEPPQFTREERMELVQAEIHSEFDDEATKASRAKMQAVLDADPRFKGSTFEVACNPHACLWIMHTQDLTGRAKRDFESMCDMPDFSLHGGWGGSGTCVNARYPGAPLPGSRLH